MKSMADIEQIRINTLGKVNLRKDSGAAPVGKVRGQVLCCGGTGCHSSGSQEIINELHAQIKAFGLEEEFDVEIANEDAEKIVTVKDAVDQIKNAIN